MKDTFLFPALDEMREPVEGAVLGYKEKKDKYLVFGYGDKITISETYESIGGSACNVAIGLARLGLKTAILSAVGKDEYGVEIEENFKKEKVATTYLKTYTSRKTSFSIIISYKGERSILVRHNFEPNDFIVPKGIDTAWLYVGPLGQDYRSVYSKITGLASENNINIALNPGSVQIHDGLGAFGALLKVTKVLFLNKEEAALILGESNLTTVKEMALRLKKEGPEIVVLTDGQNGAYVCYEGEFLKVGVYPGARVESTGAGDSFAAGFLAVLEKNENMLTSLKWGVTNSASVVGKYGAQQGLLKLTTLQKKVKDYRWPADSLRFS
jgi:ribokinase